MCVRIRDCVDDAGRCRRVNDEIGRLFFLRTKSFREPAPAVDVFAILRVPRFPPNLVDLDTRPEALPGSVTASVTFGFEGQHRGAARAPRRPAIASVTRRTASRWATAGAVPRPPEADENDARHATADRPRSVLRFSYSPVHGLLASDRGTNQISWIGIDKTPALETRTNTFPRPRTLRRFKLLGSREAEITAERVGPIWISDTDTAVLDAVAVADVEAATRSTE